MYEGIVGQGQERALRGALQHPRRALRDWLSTSSVLEVLEGDLSHAVQQLHNRSAALEAQLADSIRLTRLRKLDAFAFLRQLINYDGTRPGAALQYDYGKTSLLADWAAADSRAFAWLRVDESIDRPAVLWSAVCASLAATDASIAARVSELDLSPDSVGVLAGVLAGLPDDLVLVLDDYGSIEEPSVHESLMRFVGLAPRTLEVVLSSRSQPPWP